MNFFQQLFDQIEGMPVQLTFQRKNDKLTVSILPTCTAKIAPAIITGTPEELSKGFFDAIAAPINEVKGLQIGLDAMKASIEQAKEDDDKPAVKKKEASRKKEEKSNRAEAGSHQAQTESTETKVAAPDLFAGV